MRSVIVRAWLAQPQLNTLKIRRCRQCGTEVSRTTRRCPTCGQPISVKRRSDLS